MAAGEPEPMRRARWSTRIGAWLIDIVLVTVVVGVLGDLLAVGPGLADRPVGTAAVGRHGLLLFAYWTVFEGRTGQSLGKLVLDLRVVKADGTPATFLDAAIESFGKAFLLPLDLLIGVLAMPDDNERLFNRLSGTVVVEIDEPAQPRRAVAATA